MATRLGVPHLNVEPDVAATINLYPSNHGWVSVDLLPNDRSEPWDRVQSICANDPDALVALADLLLDAAEQLRAAQRLQAARPRMRTVIDAKHRIVHVAESNEAAHVWGKEHIGDGYQVVETNVDDHEAIPADSDAA